MTLKIIKKISLEWLLSSWPQSACFIILATLLLAESFTFEGDVFLSSSRRNGFRMILTRMDDLIENKTGRNAIASNVTRITGKLSMTGSFDWNERRSLFPKLRSVDGLELFDVYDLNNDILSSLLYVKGNLTITNSDVLSSRFDVLPNLRIIRGSFMCVDTQKYTSSLSTKSIRNFGTTLEKIGQNFELHVSESYRNVESTAFPSLESVGGSFLINATKSLRVLEIGCFRNLYHVSGDFMISGESIRSLSNFMSLQVINGRLDLKATTKLRSLDGLQNLRRVESGEINFGSALTGALFGTCGSITLDEEKMKESNKTAYVIQHSCFYDNYKWCQSMLLPNAYRCVDSIATKIIRNRNLRKFSNILESSAEILLRLQALQKPMTVFAPIDAAFLFLRSTLSEQNGRNNSEYDEPSFSVTQATLRNVARAHVFSSSIDPSTILNGEKLISNLGEKEALEILLSHHGIIDTQPRSVAHALAVQRQTLSLPLRSTSPIDSSVCTSFTFHKVEGKNALLQKYCEDATLSARIMLRPIDIMPYDEENEAASANASSSFALNLDVTSTTCLNRCGTCDNIELNTCCCDEACVQNGDCCGDFSYFCSIQYFLSREESPKKDNVVRNAFTPSRNFASGETESAALIIKSNIAQAHNGAKLILVDRVLHPIGRYHSSKLLLYKQRNDTDFEDFFSNSSPPPPPPPRPPPAPRRVTEFSWLYQTRPPPPTTSVDWQHPQPPVSPPSPAPTIPIPPQALSSPFSSPPPTSANAGSCKVQLPSICGLCDYTYESNVCCCDSLCESTGDCCEDYIETCV